MTSTLPDTPPTSNPQKPIKLRIVQADFLQFTQSQETDARGFFLPENLSWESSLGLRILAHYGPKLDVHLLENFIQPKRGDSFLLPVQIASSPRLVVGVLPKWDGGMDDEERALKKCVTGMLESCDRAGFRTLAFPALGMGGRDYPPRKAARLMMSCIDSYPYRSLQEVVIVCKTAQIFDCFSK